MNKDRGKFLTIVLVLMVINMIFVLYSATSLNYQALYKNSPSWTPTFMLINAFVDIAALIGIWLWKKWAVYLYIASAVLGVLMEVLILQPNGFTNSFIGLIMYGLVFWAISRKWKNFV